MNRNVCKLLALMAIIITAGFFTACDKNDDEVKILDATLQVAMPAGMENVSMDSLIIKLKNRATGMETLDTTDTRGIITSSIEEGIYDISVSGKKEYSLTYGEVGSMTTESKMVNMAGMMENVRITTSSRTIEVPVFVQIESKGWVIKEVYYSGSKTPGGASYNKDQFVEIYNNTDKTLYADGISLGETANLTNNDVNIYTPEINNSTFVQTLYTIPGNGQDYPVAPGKSILIAPQPINHKTSDKNPNSVDLSNADFQWYDESGNLSIDVPSVPNMIRYYSYSKTIWNLNGQGVAPLIIFKADNMNNYYNEYVDVRKNKAGNDKTSVKVPNEFILDAVEISKTNKGPTTKSLSASVDMGFTYCSGGIGSGKSVRRKIQSKTAEGRVIYQDSNNSAADFIIDSTPQPKIFE